MWVQTLAPDEATDPGNASRTGDQRGWLLLTNALETKSPDAPPRSSSLHTQQATCDIDSFATVEKSCPVSDTSISFV